MVRKTSRQVIASRPDGTRRMPDGTERAASARVVSLRGPANGQAPRWAAEFGVVDDEPQRRRTFSGRRAALEFAGLTEGTHDGDQ